MTWTRLDDNWTRDRVIRRLDHQTRWHYLCMIQECSGGKIYDGVLSLADALRCSDAADPQASVGALIAAELVENVDGETVRIINIKDHVPSQEQLDAKDQAKVRARRYRKHKAGQHDECQPDRCVIAAGFGVSESRDVTQAYRGEHARDGDRTGRDGKELPPQDRSEEDEMWEDYKRTWPETLAEDPG